MATWAQFKTGVKAHFYVGATPNDDAVVKAVSEFVKAGIIREVDHDLEQSKSYANSYALSRLSVAGYVRSGKLPAIKAGVLARITVDANRASIAGFIDKLIKESLDDLDGLTTHWDNLLLDAAVDLQRHVPCYCLRQENTYLSTTAGITIDGFVSRFTAPGAKIRAVRHGLYYAPIAEAVAYEYGDLVTSNGRLYFCDTGGTLGAGQLGAGLLTTDGTAETIGSLVFSFYGMVTLKPARGYSWAERDTLRRGEGLGACYTLTPQGDTLWFFPSIDADHQVLVEWDGLKLSFVDADTVSFDLIAQQAAAAYIRAKLAGAPFSEYQSAVRKAWVDCQEKELP